LFDISKYGLIAVQAGMTGIQQPVVQGTAFSRQHAMLPEAKRAPADLADAPREFARHLGKEQRFAQGAFRYAY